jgi:hypothetical protein
MVSTHEDLGFHNRTLQVHVVGLVEDVVKEANDSDGPSLPYLICDSISAITNTMTWDHARPGIRPSFAIPPTT